MTRPGGDGAFIPMVDLAASRPKSPTRSTQGIKKVFARLPSSAAPTSAEFEQAYARYLGAANCVGVANGTDALELALRASGVTAGGEVILPANTFIATAEAVSRMGAVPVLSTLTRCTC